MRGLKLLIELAKRSTDECSAELGQAGRAAADASAQIAAHDRSVEVERQVPLDDPAIYATLGAWSRHVGTHRSELESQRSDLELIEMAARDKLRDALSDRKRLEHALDAEERAGRVAKLRRTDEQANEIFARMSFRPAA
jgi:hypothetical protein